MPNTREGLAATHHYVNKAIADITFPATKDDISAAVGTTSVPINSTEFRTIQKLLENMSPNVYSCAAEFFCALSASLLR